MTGARRLSRRDFLKLAAAGLLSGCRRAQQPSPTPRGTTPTPTDIRVPVATVPPDVAPGMGMALVNGTLIDGTGADPVSDTTVVIQKKRIVAVGPHAQVKIPANTHSIDLQGATILPGFINAHVHAAYDESTLEAWAQGGVTTVRDVGNGGPRDELFALRDQVRAKPQCARLVAAGPMVTVPNGYPIAPWGIRALTVTSPDDARQKVEQLLDDGADVIKIALDSGAIFGQSIPTLSPEEAATIVQIAHERGTLVTAHVTAAQDLEKALDAGVDEIAHMIVDDLPDELVGRMVEDNVYWVPTLELWEHVSRAPQVSFDEQAIANLQRFVAAGGKVALGTDYAGYAAPFQLGMPMREIELMQGAGMTPLQIIVAATKHAARVCNLEREIGTLEVGKAADVLVVDGDPLEDIHALTKAKLVLRDGEVIL